MKKILVFMFAIALIATTANAGLVISVNGVVDPEDSTITLQPSETAILDIHSTTEISAANGGEGYFALLAGSGPGSIDEGTGGSANANAGVQYFGSLDDTFVPVLAAENGVWGSAFDTSGPIGAGLLIDDILFHCDGLGDVTLILVEILPDFSGFGQIYDTQIIHQEEIPEPVTMSLLALGGLGLLRRRRA